jgi:hypothetical protein
MAFKSEIEARVEREVIRLEQDLVEMKKAIANLAQQQNNQIEIISKLNAQILSLQDFARKTEIEVVKLMKNAEGSIARYE